MFGFKIECRDFLFEYGSVPKRRHKKKRLRKKYIKKYGFRKRISYTIIKKGDTLYCHSKLLDRLLAGDDFKKYM